MVARYPQMKLSDFGVKHNQHNLPKGLIKAHLEAPNLIRAMADMPKSRMPEYSGHLAASVRHMAISRAERNALPLFLGDHNDANLALIESRIRGTT